MQHLFNLMLQKHAVSMPPVGRGWVCTALRHRQAPADPRLSCARTPHGSTW